MHFIIKIMEEIIVQMYKCTCTVLKLIHWNLPDTRFLHNLQNDIYFVRSLQFDNLNRGNDKFTLGTFGYCLLKD